MCNAFINQDFVDTVVRYYLQAHQIIDTLSLFFIYCYHFFYSILCPLFCEFFSRISLNDYANNAYHLNYKKSVDLFFMS